LQRRLGIGYTRSAKLIDMMYEEGILGPYCGSKPREIFMTLQQWEASRDGTEPPGRRGSIPSQAEERQDEEEEEQ